MRSGSRRVRDQWWPRPYRRRPGGLDHLRAKSTRSHRQVHPSGVRRGERWPDQPGRPRWVARHAAVPPCGTALATPARLLTCGDATASAAAPAAREISRTDVPGSLAHVVVPGI